MVLRHTYSWRSHGRYAMVRSWGLYAGRKHDGHHPRRHNLYNVLLRIDLCPGILGGTPLTLLPIRRVGGARTRVWSSLAGCHRKSVDRGGLHKHYQPADGGKHLLLRYCPQFACIRLSSRWRHLRDSRTRRGWSDRLHHVWNRASRRVVSGYDQRCYRDRWVRVDGTAIASCQSGVWATQFKTTWTSTWLSIPMGCYNLGAYVPPGTKKVQLYYHVGVLGGWTTIDSYAITENSLVTLSASNHCLGVPNGYGAGYGGTFFITSYGD